MADALIELFSEVLNVPAGQLEESSSPESVKQWDSVAAMHLVASLEEEFDIELATVEIMEMRSIGGVRKILREKGIDV